MQKTPQIRLSKPTKRTSPKIPSNTHSTSGQMLERDQRHACNRPEQQFSLQPILNRYILVPIASDLVTDVNAVNVDLIAEAYSILFFDSFPR